MAPLQIVWFKRDLRSVDHQPLLQASRLGAVLPLVVVEPEFWRQDDASARHWAFCAEGLEELRTELARLGQPLVVRLGAVEDVLWIGLAGSSASPGSGAMRKRATAGPTPAIGVSPPGLVSMASPGIRSRSSV
jgi:hypothetical protein